MGITRLKPAYILTIALCVGLFSASAQAVMFDLYNDINPTGYIGDGSELATALVAPGSGINILSGSSQFQGNFDNALGGGFGGCGIECIIIDPIIGDCGIECGFGGFGGFGDSGFGSSSQDYGSASFFTDLNLGSRGNTDFVLPDGILLTSGFAAPAETNTQSGFTGIASLQGDAGLDALLASQGLPDITSDATVLSFDFTVDANINAISLDFIFGSDEYPEFIDNFPEIAAVFVDGVNYAGFADGNLLTLTDSTVGSGNFFNNDPWENGPITNPLAIEYDGVSAPLTLLGLLDNSLVKHTLKLAISDTNDTVVDTGIFVANLQGLMLGGAGGNSGTSPTDPLLPDSTNPDGGFNFVVNVGDTGVGIDPTLPIFIDPYVATGYEYEVTGSTFATALIPNDYGDDIYNLYVWNGIDYMLIDGAWNGDQFNFLDLYAGGVSKFMINGIEISTGLDPADSLAFVTGLTFTSGGTFNVTQTAIQTCDGAIDCSSPVDVPEPGTLLLLAGGLLGLRAVQRKKH